jgi:hypothetical protein
MMSSSGLVRIPGGVALPAHFLILADFSRIETVRHLDRTGGHAPR